MWPSIKHLRDLVVDNLRVGPQSQTIHYSFEKAGLILHDQPIPWNAEVVLVEALVKLPPSVSRRKADYTIRLPDREPLPAESLRQSQSGEDRSRLLFRIPTPTLNTTAEVFYRSQRLGQLKLPVLTREEFLQQLRLQLPTLYVRLGEHTVACQTFVSTQCKGMTANALLVSPTSLVPLIDLGLQVEFRSERGAVHTVPAKLCSSQLGDRQALISVVPRRFPKRIGAWLATWMIGERVLATQRIRAISQRQFQRSLRVSDTRFVLQNHRDEVNLSRQVPPLDEVERLGPCFLVSSKEPGMAGLCSLQMRVQVNGSAQPPTLPPQDVLITDGPTLVAPGTLRAADVEQVTSFELLLKNHLLGHLPLSPVPIAAFTNEGGFKPPVDFTWSIAADEELNERLTRLLDGSGKE